MSTASQDRYIQGAKRMSVWNFIVEGRQSGSLELYLNDSGFFWCWDHKPANLVPIAGVMDDDEGRPNQIPSRFFDHDYAVGHIMANTGHAFRGICCLEAIEPAAASVAVH